MTVKKEAVMLEIGGAVAPSFSSAMEAVTTELTNMNIALANIQAVDLSLVNYGSAQVVEAGDGLRLLGNVVGMVGKSASGMTHSIGTAQLGVQSISGSIKLTTKEFVSIGRAVKKAGSRLSSFVSETKKAASLRQISKNMASIGEAVKTAGNRVRTFVHETKKCTASQKKFSSSLKVTRSRLGKLGGARRIKGIGNALRAGAVGAQKFSKGLGFMATVGAKISNINTITASQARLAKSLGISAKGLETWEGIASKAGLKAGGVGNLIKEMNDKFGRIKLSPKDNSFGSALDTLGLSLKEVEKLSPEQRMKTITSALMKMGDADKAKSLSSQLLGGNAPQLISYLQSTGKSLEDVYEKQAKQSLVTEEGRQGAVKYATAMKSINSVVSSASAEFSGLIGGALEPYVATLAPKIGALFNEHREDIKKFGAMIGEALPKIGEFAFTLLGVLTNVGSAILKVVDFLGGFGVVATAVGAIMTAKFAFSGYKMAQTIWSIGQAVAPIITTAFPALIAGIKTVGVAFITNPIGLAIGAIALAIGTVYAKWDSLKKYFVAGLNVLGRVFAYSPIGLIVRGIGAAIDLVSEKWGALKEAFTGGVVGKLVTSIFGDDEDEQPQKVKKNNRERTATEAPVGKSAEKTLARPSVEQKKVKSSFGDSVKASTKATPHETSIAGVDKQGNGVEAKQSYSLAAATSSPKSLPAKADSKQQVITNYVTINVTAGEGQDSKEIADDVHDKFVTSSSGAMYDE
ncbi:hypothetical protein [Halodesulfovibrio sp.]|uniref:hypothetical protein n=1 Tax=Halodesulfovibrio sp. TaxID=1912772 RepID=UPI0025BDFF31|nr:hypothetical protein [Halodesulfovibrio sp.]